MIFVTGGCGFIGSNFILHVRKNYREKVVNIDALTYAGVKESLAELNSDEDYIFFHGSINDSKAVSAILRKYKPKAVINFAAESHVDRSIQGPDSFVETNVVGTFNLVTQIKKFWDSLETEYKNSFRFIHISTDEVYGSLEPEAAAFREESAYCPTSPYAASKAASDHLVKSFFHTYGLPIIVTHCSNNYGPMQYPEKLIPVIITKALNGRPIPIYGNGLQIRDWVHVEDHCSAICTVLDRGRVGETYNIGGNTELTNIEVTQSVCAYLDEYYPNPNYSYLSLIKHVNDRPGHDRRYAVDISKIHSNLGWFPKETFKSGIEKTVEWYVKNPIWIEKAFQNK